MLLVCRLETGGTAKNEKSPNPQLPVKWLGSHNRTHSKDGTAGKSFYSFYIFKKITLYCFHNDLYLIIFHTKSENSFLGYVSWNRNGQFPAGIQIHFPELFSTSKYWDGIESLYDFTWNVLHSEKEGTVVLAIDLIDLSLSSALWTQMSQWHSSLNFTRTLARTIL